ATRWHCGQREAARCSIICSGAFCSGVREAGLNRGWAEKDAAWLRTPVQPWGASVPPMVAASWSRGGSSRLEDGHPVVGTRAADRLGQSDHAPDLSSRHAPSQLPHALDDLRDSRRGERMAARLEAAGGIDRQAPLERGLAVERGRSRLAGREKP